MQRGRWNFNLGFLLSELGDQSNRGVTFMSDKVCDCAAEPRSNENPAESHQAECLCAIRRLLHAATAQTRLSVGIVLYHGSRVFRFSVLSLIFDRSLMFICLHIRHGRICHR